jgi:internalin A
MTMQYCTIDDRAGEGLGQLTSLQELDLRLTKVTEKIVPQLSLKSLTHLRLPHTAVTDATCELLAKHGKLHTLDQCWSFLPNGKLGKVAADDQHIQQFNLSATATTEKTLQLFLNLPIRSLTPALGLTDEGMVTIGKLSELEFLSLEKQTAVTDAGCKHLANLKKLKGIGFTNTRITDAGIEHLRGATELTSLSLEKTLITDVSLRLAEGLPNLKSLNVHGTKVTSAGLRQFHKTNPKCSIAAPSGWRQ